jgi:hypothetical protein
VLLGSTWEATAGFFRRAHVVIPGTIKLFNVVYEHKVWAVVSVFHAAGVLACADGVDASSVGQGNSSLLPCFSALISKDFLYDLVAFDFVLDRIEVLNRSLDCGANNDGVVKCLNERPENQALLGQRGFGRVAEAQGHELLRVSPVMLDQAFVKRRVEVGVAVAKENEVAKGRVGGKFNRKFVNHGKTAAQPISGAPH